MEILWDNTAFFDTIFMERNMLAIPFCCRQNGMKMIAVCAFVHFGVISQRYLGKASKRIQQKQCTALRVSYVEHYLTCSYSTRTVHNTYMYLASICTRKYTQTTTVYLIW